MQKGKGFTGLSNNQNLKDVITQRGHKDRLKIISDKIDRNERI